ncbi:MAG TPA: hypothetical protein PLN33_05385, partial [Hyphomonadaceae bacterium]|nr:hypothetical protein [Hyphomonadaceae bacterium]
RLQVWRLPLSKSQRFGIKKEPPENRRLQFFKTALRNMESSPAIPDERSTLTAIANTPNRVQRERQRLIRNR